LGRTPSTTSIYPRLKLKAQVFSEILDGKKKASFGLDNENPRKLRQKQQRKCRLGERQREVSEDHQTGQDDAEQRGYAKGADVHRRVSAGRRKTSSHCHMDDEDRSSFVYQSDTARDPSSLQTPCKSIPSGLTTPHTELSMVQEVDEENEFTQIGEQAQTVEATQLAEQ